MRLQLRQKCNKMFQEVYLIVQQQVQAQQRLQQPASSPTVQLKLQATHSKETVHLQHTEAMQILQLR